MVQSISEIMQQIKNGNETVKNDFIADYIPFIIKIASKYTERYIDVNNSDELGIGMSAFSEAINRYDDDKGSFMKFAEVVIKSRLVDFNRKESKKTNVLNIDEVDEPFYHDNTYSRMEIKEEIVQFEKALKEYNISFSKLASTKPKHADTRSNAIKIAENITQNELLMADLKKKRRLPYRAVANNCNTTEKVVKKNEKYIIACILILSSDWDHLKDFMKVGVESA